MEKTISKSDFIKAEAKMEHLLAKATERGGFYMLTSKESRQLEEYTEVVRQYEAQNIHIPMPTTISGLLQLKMYENQLKQKDLAKLLETSNTRLSEIMHEKRKPTLNFLKSINQKYYNNQRPHSGKFCYGKTPMETFLSSKWVYNIFISCFIFAKRQENGNSTGTISGLFKIGRRIKVDYRFL